MPPLKRLGVRVRVLPDTRFLRPLPDFFQWAASRRELRMEYFYRDMRRHFGVLMRGTEPEGGQWNFDKENRKSPPKGLKGPRRLSWRHDAITRDVLTRARAGGDRELVAAWAGALFVPQG